MDRMDSLMYAAGLYVPDYPVMDSPPVLGGDNSYKDEQLPTLLTPISSGSMEQCHV